MTSSLILLLIDAKRQHKQHACSAAYSRVRAMHAWYTSRSSYPCMMPARSRARVHARAAARRCMILRHGEISACRILQDPRP